MMAVAIRDPRTEEVTKHLAALVGEAEHTDVLLFPEKINTLGVRSCGGGLKKDILIAAEYIDPPESPAAPTAPAPAEDHDGEQL